ncbi:MAG: hypothetical protein H5T69_00480 [Chloroflexi bacterium]|nr:hypothetical protein [Chloroflexota bacterium]
MNVHESTRLTLGLDLGTSTLSAVVLDVTDGRVVCSHTKDNTAAYRPGPGRAELDLDRLRTQLFDLLAEVVELLADCQEEVGAIGVTGQQHGTALLGSDLKPLAPAITWQDRRVEERPAGASMNYLERFIAKAGGEVAFGPLGCRPAAGYLGPTLFWLRAQGRLPGEARACFIPDAAVTWLTGQPPVTDPTDAGSSALYNVLEGRWAWELIDRLGLPRALFPEVRPTGSLAGGLGPEVAARVGLPAGLPVAVALGDNQASFLGSVAEPARSLLINIGTGGQISAQIDAFRRLPGFDTRAFPPDADGRPRYLLVGAGYFGGRTYAYLRDFFGQVGRAFFGASGDEPLYDVMNRLAAEVPPGAEGVRCEPLFTGSRDEPHRRASFTGLSPDTFTPGHLARALLEGIALGYGQLYAAMRPLIGEREQLVGAGNGLRRNPLLADILSAALGLPLQLTEHEEAAAYGAALVAATAVGLLPHLDKAAALLRKRLRGIKSETGAREV